MPEAASLGPLVRLRQLQPTELPAHRNLELLQTGSTPLSPKAFAQNVLDEAKAFTTDYWPKKFAVKSASRDSPPSKATVELSSRDVATSEIPESVRATTSPETWFGRSSTHDNRAETGTAEWAEFERYLLDDHARHEMEYTPDVYDAHQVMRWDPAELEGIPGWEKVEMSINEMAHSIPVVNNRVFPVLLLSARTAAPFASFLTVQIPVDAAQIPNARYANGSHKTAGETAQQREKITLGVYVSVERAELVDQGERVKWQMATASDAKGNLPLWAQKLGVPGAVVKDVGLFIDYVAKQRSR